MLPYVSEDSDGGEIMLWLLVCPLDDLITLKSKVLGFKRLFLKIELSSRLKVVPLFSFRGVMKEAESREGSFYSSK